MEDRGGRAAQTDGVRWLLPLALMPHAGRCLACGSVCKGVEVADKRTALIGISRFKYGPKSNLSTGKIARKRVKLRENSCG
jgi:hypothetical protein